MSRITHILQKIRWKNFKKMLRYIKKNGCKGLGAKLRWQMNHQDFDEIYGKWLPRHRIGESEMLSQAEEAKALTYQPLISILVPTYKTPIGMFRQMVDSVRAQTYPNWQLCIADGSEDDKALWAELENYHQLDGRIVYRILDKNQGISMNTNAALELAEGEFIGLLDHDDILEPDALFEVVRELQDGRADIVYTDEDKVNENLTVYGDPNFKPDFSIDLLRSHNYITHFLVIRKSIIEAVGAFRPEFDGSQDYDLLLRCVEKAGEIRHVARILYHWRMCDGSTAADPRNKLYCYDAGKRALEEHLDRVGLKGRVDYAGEGLWGLYHVTYDVIGNPMVSIVIANKDHTDDLDTCIRSVEEHSTYRNFEIIVVENNSTDAATFSYYESIQATYDNVRVVTWEKEFNYSAINNFGVGFAKGEYILLLNNDTEMLAPTAIEEMLGICMRDDVGIVGAKLLYADDTVQHAGVVIGFGGYAGHVFNGIKNDEYGYMMRAVINCNYSAVTAACLMTKRSIFEQVGGLTESFVVAGNDVDYCLKVRKAGYLVVYSAFSVWHHYESKSRGYEDTPEKQARFEGEVAHFGELWADVLAQGDPYYNKNFPITIAPFTLD